MEADQKPASSYTQIIDDSGSDLDSDEEKPGEDLRLCQM